MKLFFCPSTGTGSAQLVCKVQTHKWITLVRVYHEVGSAPCKLLIDRYLDREQYRRAVRMRESCMARTLSTKSNFPPGWEAT